ncbi:MAG: GrpB family protein [Myxococcota bacterium]|nr:GrpB family protein [Myxococcota bacterium]
MRGGPPIEIVDYEPAWPARFREEAERIRAALGAAALRVDHVGSTAVPGLAAKPVIDIQVSVARLHPIVPWVRALEGLGYTHVPHPDDATYPFLHRPADWPHSHHVHLCTAGSVEERENLAFRDLLRAEPAEAAAYEALKRRLAARHHAGSFASRNAYAQAKSDFIAPRVARALGRAAPASSGR